MMKTKLFFLTLLLSASALLLNAPLNPVIAQAVDVIVIDPGHGGVFPGAVYAGVKEKDLTLAVARRLGALISRRHPDVKVVYTRTSDKELSRTLTTDLGMRSKIAKEADGKLFISIHANAATNKSAYGAETIIMGESSLEQSRNDAALYEANREDLIDMSDKKTAAIVRAYIQNLQFTYGQYSEALARLIMKGYGDHGRNLRALRRQPIMVLYGTDMPCVLTEIGFISNEKERAFLTSSKGQDDVAESIYSGVNAYITMMNKNLSTVKELEQPSGGYTIQILSSSKSLKLNDWQFRNYKNKVWERVTSGNFKYKYCIGKFQSRTEAQKELSTIKRNFKDAYIIEY